MQKQKLANTFSVLGRSSILCWWTHKIARGALLCHSFLIRSSFSDMMMFYIQVLHLLLCHLEGFLGSCAVCSCHCCGVVLFRAHLQSFSRLLWKVEVKGVFHCNREVNYVKYQLLTRNWGKQIMFSLTFIVLEAESDLSLSGTAKRRLFWDCRPFLPFVSAAASSNWDWLTAEFQNLLVRQNKSWQKIILYLWTSGRLCLSF